MPQVASEATTYAHKPTLPNPARAAQSSDQAPDLPFASLLDDGTQAASGQAPPSPPSSGDNTAFAALPDLALLPILDSNAAQPGNDTTGLAGNAAQLVDNSAQPGESANSPAAAIVAAIAAAISADKAVGADQANVDAKSGEQAAAGDDVKPAGDGKPTDGLTPPDPAAVPASDPLQTTMPVAAPAPAPSTIAPAAPPAVAQPAPAAVLQATADGVLQAAPATVPQAAPAAKHPAIVANAAPKAKPANLAAPQADTSDPADDSNPPAKTSFVLPSDGKPQRAAGDADKPAVTPPRDTIAANSHHTAATETPPVIATDGQAAAPKAAADAVQQAALTPPPHNVSSTPANPAAPAPPAAPAAAVPLAGIAIEIAGKALAGKNRFEIRLDPPELGRIEVRLDVARDGHVTSMLIADRSDTLDLLRRDAAGLERALQDAGLKTSDNGLQFSLRDQTTGRDQASAPTPGAAQLVVSDDALAAIDAGQRNYGRLAGLGGGIDIRV